MTNEDKYKTIKERIKAFKKFCDSHTCDDCQVFMMKVNDLCFKKWIKLEATEEKVEAEMNMTLNEELAKSQAKPTVINYKSKYLAIALVAGRAIVLHTTTESPMYSYGIPHWEDDNGTDYGQIELPDMSIRIVSITEVDEEMYDMLYRDNDSMTNDRSMSLKEKSFHNVIVFGLKTAIDFIKKNDEDIGKTVDEINERIMIHELVVDIIYDAITKGRIKKKGKRK